jgi:rubrerythrin
MANEVRLIDANALQRRICKAKCNREYEDCRDEGDCEFDFFIFWAPTIDPESLRPKGRWLGEGDGYADGEIVYDVWYCSECNYCIDDGTDDPEMLPNYCPNCGAKREA